VDIKKRKDARDLHPSAVFVHERVDPGVLPEALERLGRWVAANGIDAPGEHRGARDLLLKRVPRLRSASAGALRRRGESPVAAARRLVLELGDGVLPIQGPPGTGKTDTGARMICELVRAGKRVGVTAVSHKVIGNLLEAVVRAAREEGIDLRCLHKVTDTSKELPEGMFETTSNASRSTSLMSLTMTRPRGCRFERVWFSSIDRVDHESASAPGPAGPRSPRRAPAGTSRRRRRPHPCPWPR
jgi:uncharacterized protein